MLVLVRQPLAPAAADTSLAEVDVRADRLVLAKRLWRGTAADGTEFGFELESPLRPGDLVYRTDRARYIVRQNPEPVLVVSLALAPSAAAGIGWAVGNLHLELSAEPDRLLAPDEPAVRRLFERIQIPYTIAVAVFRPGRFARGPAAPQELGPSHRH